MSQQVSKIISIVQTGALVIGGYYVYKFLSGGAKIIDKTTTFLADAYVKNTTDVIRPTIGVKSDYFTNGKLNIDAREVYATGFPNMYFKIFAQDRLKPEFASLLDNGDRYTDDEFNM